MTTDELLKLLKDKADEDDIPEDFPPLTEDQVAQYEQEMGVKLPELLKLIYTKVANGGIGADCMLIPLYEEDSEESVHHMYLNWMKQQPVIEDFDDEDGDIIPEWIPGVIPLADMGCAMYALLDCNVEGGVVVNCDFDLGPVNFKQEWESSEEGFFDRPGVPFVEWITNWAADQ
jgi:hypothetical protein